MRSRIFQVSNEPITKEDFIISEYLYDEMPSSMDYISDETNREEDIKWLKDCIPQLIVDGDKITVNAKALKEWAEMKIANIKKVADTLTVEDLSYGCYLLKEAIDDAFGFYVYDGYLRTMDSWMMGLPYKCKNADGGELVYYIGATLDYHS